MSEQKIGIAETNTALRFPTMDAEDIGPDETVVGVAPDAQIITAIRLLAAVPK